MITKLSLIRINGRLNRRISEGRIDEYSGNKGRIALFETCSRVHYVEGHVKGQ